MTAGGGYTARKMRVRGTSRSDREDWQTQRGRREPGAARDGSLPSERGLEKIATKEARAERRKREGSNGANSKAPNGGGAAESRGRRPRRSKLTLSIDEWREGGGLSRGDPERPRLRKRHKNRKTLIDRWTAALAASLDREVG